MKEKNHPVFQAPENPNIKIWRFMDFTKYVSLIATRSLFFSRIDKLALDDPYEGSMPISNILYQNNHISPEILEEQLVAIKERRNWAYANCWYMDDHESNLMWKAYTKNEREAIAIQSTYTLLRECLPDYRKTRIKSPTHNTNDSIDRYMDIGVVKYINTQESLPRNNTLWQFMHKRNYFKDEKELRALIIDMPVIDLATGRASIENPTIEGVSAKIDLNNLIQSVYVSPFAEDWFESLVKNVTQTYIPKHKFSIQQSQMGGQPLF